VLVALCQAGAASAQPSPNARPPVPELRKEISFMEGILERAVVEGIRGAQAEMPELMSGPWMMASPPRARGFKVDGYGVFFDVEVPGLPASITWSLEVVNRTNDAAIARELDRLRLLIGTVSDPKVQAQLATAVNDLQQHVPGAAALSDPSMRMVNGKVQSAAPMRTPPPPSPNEVYTRQVKNALVAVMLQQGVNVEIGPDDWFTVAACDSQGSARINPGEPELMTLYLSIKGKDLAALKARQITAEEAAKRIIERNY
jgi:hypothetical protein